MKGIITYLLVYIFIGLLPSHGNSLSIANSGNNLSYDQEHFIKKQQDSPINLFEFISENENEEDEFNCKKDLSSHLGKIIENKLYSPSFQLVQLNLNYLSHLRAISITDTPIYQLVRNLRI